METTKRLPRYKRTADEELSLRLQGRDREILKLVHDYRFLSSRQIQRLMPGSDQVILRRLQKLFHLGYLDRVRTTSNNEAMLYALGNKGADELTLWYGIDRGRIDWTTKNREAGERYLHHICMIGRFRETLTLATWERPGTKLVSWNPEGRLTDDVVVEAGREEASRASLIPDGFFTLQDRDEEMYFFLEADRSTMTNHRFLHKMKAYWAYWRDRKHKTQLNIENFRVLSVTKTEERKENLRKITKGADDKQSGSLMFWFASEEHYTPDDPASLLRPIWQTPRNDDWHQLLE
jgi:DNA-binding HxlR family transcriptional regulator